MCGASTPNTKSPTFIPEHPHFITNQHPLSNTQHLTASIKVCGFFKLSVPLQDKTIIDKTMQETRQNRISRLLQKELASIFQTQTRMMHGVLVSVTRVKVSPDLSICTAYLSIFPSEKGDEILKNINANEKTIRYDLGQRVHNQLRIIPELRFFIDDSLDYLERIDELLKK